MRRTICTAIVAVALAGCAGSSASPAAPPSLAPTTAPSTAAVAPGPPSGVIAFGHSGLTGEGTGGIVMAVPENSWATGTSPDVNSVYLRLKAAHPDLAGIPINQAHGGASAFELPDQAKRALSSVPNPALTIIQTIDNDIRCDGTDEEHVPKLGGYVAEALDMIAKASPDGKILVVGQLGRPSIPFVEELIARDPSVVEPLKDGGMCALLDADGKPIKANFDYLSGLIEAYEAEQARVCAAVPQCHTDDGVRAAYVDKLENFSSDWAHLNIKGQAAEAALIWPVVAKLFEP